MPSVATGANMANRNLLYIGVSGDGDTASIGMGQFVHAVRRNINMVYICENNGVYGLTKGQDSRRLILDLKVKKAILALTNQSISVRSHCNWVLPLWRIVSRGIKISWCPSFKQRLLTKVSPLSM